MFVIDASALLAFALGERGADEVEAAMVSGATCSAANWSEVAQKVMASGANWDLVAALFDSYHLSIEPVTRHDAESAALRWRRGEGLSLADRLCIVLGRRLDADVLTADSAWGDGDRIRQIR